MPSVSKRQRSMMARDLRRARSGKKTRTGMSVSQLEEFASTPAKGLPYRAESVAKKRRRKIAEIRRGGG